MRVLITGAAGFVGQHLARLLVQRGHDVYGTCISGDSEANSGEIQMLACDVREQSQVAKTVIRAAPDRIFHLAALSSVRGSFENEQEVYRTNFTGTLYLLEAAKNAAPKARILLVSSSQVYGNSVNEGPIGEDAPLRPASPYAVSKAAADLLGYEYYASHALHVVRVRPFNHTGPGQSCEFVCSDFARQIARIARNKQPPTLHVGNLNVARDISDVRDVACAYVTLLETAAAGEVYNIGSGRLTWIHEIVEFLSSLLPMKVEVNVAEDRVRSREPSAMVANIERSTALGAWNPEYSLRRTLTDLFEFWKGQC